MPHISHDRLRRLVLRDEPTELQRVVADRAIDVPSRSTRERFPSYTSFPFGWFVAVPSDDLEPGQIATIRRMDLDLVVWRTADGTASVSAAHCPHRGSHLGVGGEVDGCEIVCPYHWWRFDTAGVNTAIPYRNEPSPARLRTYPTVERGGLIMFWYHPDPTEGPRWELPSIPEEGDDEWGPFVPHSLTFRAPWIEVCENYPDKVHVRTVHSVDTFAEIDDLTFTEFTHTQRTRFEHEPGVTSSMTTEAFGPGFSVVRSRGVVDWTFILGIVAIDWEQTVAFMGYRLRRNLDHADDVRYREIEALMIDFSKQQWAEDAAIFSHKIETPIRGDDPEDAPARRYRAWAERFHRSP